MSTAVSAVHPLAQQTEPGWLFTHHARQRMSVRGLSPSTVALTLRYGRTVYTRGAEVYALGRKEVRRFARLGVDLSTCEGVQVVCLTDGTVLTAYRNRDFRGLRSRRPRTSRREGR